VVLSESKDEPETEEAADCLNTDNYLKPDVVHVPEPCEDDSQAIRSIHDLDTTRLLEKAQLLLESVKTSLTNIEGVSKQAGAVLEAQQHIHKERRKPRKMATLSPAGAGRSQERSRRTSAVRRSRWEKKFSCDVSGKYTKFCVTQALEQTFTLRGNISDHRISDLAEN